MMKGTNVGPSIISHLSTRETLSQQLVFLQRKAMLLQDIGSSDIRPIGIESIGIFYKENTAAPYGDTILHRSAALKGWGGLS